MGSTENGSIAQETIQNSIDVIRQFHDRHCAIYAQGKKKTKNTLNAAHIYHAHPRVPFCALHKYFPESLQLGRFTAADKLSLCPYSTTINCNSLAIDV